MTNVVPFPSTALVAEEPSDPADERTFLHCALCKCAHFVIEVVSENERQVRCGFPACEQIIQDMVWWESE